MQYNVEQCLHRRRGRRARFARLLTVAALFGLGAAAAPAQTQAPYHLAQIVWVVIGEAGGGSPQHPARAGRHLFMAGELADYALKHIDVARVDAMPEVIEIAVAERFCVTSLRLTAHSASGDLVDGAPMSVSVRQDHKEPMGLRRSKNDICVNATKPGEYPIRFSSLVPARDGTNRGAQIFVRVRDDSTDARANRATNSPDEE